jgi:hypothetical protein
MDAGMDAMGSMNQNPPAFDVDLDDLPKYDEDYHKETNHQLSLNIFVRNL